MFFFLLIFSTSNKDLVYMISFKKIQTMKVNIFNINLCFFYKFNFCLGILPFKFFFYQQNSLGRGDNLNIK